MCINVQTSTNTLYTGALAYNLCTLYWLLNRMRRGCIIYLSIGTICKTTRFGITYNIIIVVVQYIKPTSFYMYIYYIVRIKNENGIRLNFKCLRDKSWVLIISITIYIINVLKLRCIPCLIIRDYNAYGLACPSIVPHCTSIMDELNPWSIMRNLFCVYKARSSESLKSNARDIDFRNPFKSERLIDWKFQVNLLEKVWKFQLFATVKFANNTTTRFYRLFVASHYERGTAQRRRNHPETLHGTPIVFDWYK